MKKRRSHRVKPELKSFSQSELLDKQKLNEVSAGSDVFKIISDRSIIGSFSNDTRELEVKL